MSESVCGDVFLSICVCICVCVCTQRNMRKNERKEYERGYIVNVHKQGQSRNSVIIVYETERAHVERVPVNVLSVKFII